MSTPRPATAVPSHARRTFASRLRSLAAAGVLLAAGAVAACSDSPMAPAAPAPSPAPAQGLSLGGLTQALTSLANVALRSSPLTRPERTSKVIGSEGGTFSLPLSGLTVTVPAGAVSVPTTFTVVAPTGSGVWYEFGPSGARFAKPLTVTQDLRLLSLLRLPLASKLEVGYFVDGTQSETSGTAQVQEWLPLTVNATRSQGSFEVHHFSGYMVSTGRR